VRFFTEDGAYLIDRVSLKTELKEAIAPVYYFEINETRYGRVQNDTLDVIMRIKFVDDDETKRADIIINGHKTYLNTRDAEYSKDVSPYAVKDTNYIRIEPETTLYVVELMVELE